MGAHIDIYRRSREYDRLYPLDQPYGVRRVLEDWRLLEIDGTYESAEVMTDARQAFGEARLTDKQRRALRLVLVDGWTQEEAARQLGYASHKGVNEIINRAVMNVAKSQGFDERAWKDKYDYFGGVADEFIY